MNAIAIQTLTQPHTCEMGSLSFVATSKLKFVSTNGYSFPSMLSTERTNGEIFPVSHDKAYLVYLYFNFPNDPRSYPLVP